MDFIGSLLQMCGIRDTNGDLVSVPLLLVKGDNKVHMEDEDFFLRHFSNVACLLGIPGEGKSTFASAVYRVMRKTNTEYFKSSQSSVSFTKGVWRLSNKQKLQGIVDRRWIDLVDILDVEGYEAKNEVIYMILCSIILSNAVVIMGKTRINMDTIAMLNTVFHVLEERGISLSKPKVFIQVTRQTRGQDEGKVKIGDAYYGEQEALKEIKKIAPKIKDLDVELFSLYSFPSLRNLQELYEVGDLNRDPKIVYNERIGLYDKSVMEMVKKLSSVAKKETVERRIHYLRMVKDFLNKNSPDLALKHAMIFFKQQMTECIEALVSREKVNVADAHRDKEYKGQKFEEFYLWKSTVLEEYKEKWENSQYIPKACNDSTRKEFGNIASTVLEEVEYTSEVPKAVAKQYYDTKKATATVDEQAIANKIRTEMMKNIHRQDEASYYPSSSFKESITEQYPMIKNIGEVYDRHMKLIAKETYNKSQALINESKWTQKVITNCPPCRHCGAKFGDGLFHRGCSNTTKVPTLLYYWIKNSANDIICNGCDTLSKIEYGISCYSCDKDITKESTVVIPNW